MKNLLALLQRKAVISLKTFLVLILVTASLSSSAQNQTKRQTPKSGIWYFEYLPPDYNSNTNNYPIVFFLHGLGERGDTETELDNVAKNGPPKYVKAGYKFPFILISPQLKWKYTGWPNSYTDEVIEYCRNNLRVDQSRIYLTGLSLGGGGTWGYSQDPVLNQKLAAIAPVCGHQNNMAKACIIVESGIPVWGFHGSNDQTVPYARTVNMIKAINECVPAPNPLALITIYQGVGHNSWDQAYRTDHSLHNPNVYEWLLQFKNGGIKVSAGNDITLNMPASSTNITGTASSDTGPITSYTWTKISGPSATLTNPTTPTLSLTGMTTAGIYTFSLKATTATETATDEVKVTVVAANQAPVANAGVDVNLTLPVNAVNLNGSGTDADGSIASYTWAKVSGPAVTTSSLTSATLSLSGLIQGTYVFSLTVKDNQNATAVDNVTIVVNPAIVNQLPTANAGLDKIVNLPTNTLNLTGSGSDPDGTIASYQWIKFSGPTVTLTNPTSTTVSLSALVAGSYIFQLTVKDDAGASAIDQVAVTVNAANQSPTASVGPNIVLTQPTSTTNISGSGSDPEGSVLTYAWTQVDGPTTATIQNPSSPTVTIKDLTDPSDVYIFRLTVTDNKGATGIADVTVTVNSAPVNVPPVAIAGTDKSITLPINSITLVGSGTDSDGSVTGYNWAKLSGPSATPPADENLASVTYTNLIAGSYIFRLTVTDNQGATHTDDIGIVVQPEVVNQSPLANAGTDAAMTLPINSATLSGSGTDPDGTIATYSWVNLSAPALPATLSGQATPTLQVSDLIQGTYTFQLIVTDNKGATDTDEVTVSVNAANVPPVANAGLDITITSPASSTIITGSGSDIDGTIASYSWAQVTSLPSVATLTNENTSTLSVSGLGIGTYTFRLTVTDDDGDTGTDDVKVIVNAPANQSPTANAGLDKIITLPTNSANFTGSGTDPDGTIASYAWTQIGVPAATLTNNNSPTLTVEVPGAGTYTFRLTVTDNTGASDFDDVTLTVNGAANQPPTADAGTGQSITLPVNSLNLTGSGSNADGSIIKYQWTVVSGPTVTLTNDNTSTVSLSNMIEGNYTFQLMVTDDGLLTATSQVSVTVLPAAVNQQPSANAGIDQILTLPTNSITIFGNGSDPDGTVVTYFWTKISGTGGTLGPVNQSTLSLSDLTAGVYVFRLEVKDDKNATATDDVTVTVKAIATNKAPVANAGPDQMISLPTDILTLTGSGSDADGFITAYSWVKLSGPTVTTLNLNQANLDLSDLKEGIYKFRLRVKDNATPGATGTDDVTVTVNPAATNQPPVVSVGSDKVIFQPSSSVTMDGTSSDPDGNIKSLLWIQIGGPSTATLVNATSNSLTADGLSLPGDYFFRLTATDNDDATASDEIKITVKAAGNMPPTVNAGPDISTKNKTDINLTLTASGFDPDGSIASYHWEQISGPLISFTDANPLVIPNMPDGSYLFKVTVTDNGSPAEEASDFVNVTILPSTTNIPPIVNAGSDVSIQLPENSLTLVGTVTDDEDPSPTGLWKKISGPSAVPDVASNTLALTGLVEGVYEFEFSATDTGLGNFSDADNVIVAVFAPEPTRPDLTVTIEGDSLLIHPDNTANLTALCESNGLLSFKWEQIFGNPVTLGADTTTTLEVNDLSMIGSYIFRVTVKDETGQEAKSEFKVVVIPEPIDPISPPSNSFSPNNDGKYDSWSLGEESYYNGCEISVFNRQGSRVYQSKGYEIAWDGNFNGKPLPEGVYFYVIRCSSDKPKTGSVTIIR